MTKTVKSPIQPNNPKPTPMLINTSKKTSLISTRSAIKVDSLSNLNKAKTEPKKTKHQLED